MIDVVVLQCDRTHAGMLLARIKQPPAVISKAILDVRSGDGV
jgi:hypothetical protein